MSQVLCFSLNLYLFALDEIAVDSFGIIYLCSSLSFFVADPEFSCSCPTFFLSVCFPKCLSLLLSLPFVQAGFVKQYPMCVVLFCPLDFGFSRENDVCVMSFGKKADNGSICHP